MSEEVALAYPVMIPIPATNCQDTESRTSQASPPPPPPTWVGRKVTNSAENRKPGLLVNSTDTERPIKQPVSYLAVAKRGTSTVGTRGSSRGRANTGGGRFNQSQPHADSPDRAQTNGTAPEATRKASEPKSKASVPTHPTVGQTVQPQKSSAAQRVNNDLSQPDSSIVIQLLQVAKGLGGISKMEVEIGRILVKTDRIQPTNVYNAWSSIFGVGTETIFTNRLPNPHFNLSFPSNLKEKGGRQVFADIPYDSNIRYEFLCTTILGDEDVVLDVSQSGNVQVFGSEHVVGAFQWHFPKRQWDARLVIKSSERIADYYEDAVKAVTSSLSVIPSPDQTTASLFADLGNSGLMFKSASVLREVRFRCLADPEIRMICTETQHLGEARDRKRFFNRALDRAAAESKGDLWWEIKLECTETSTKLEQDANWSAEKLVEMGVAERLQAIATDIVTQIDGIGAGVKQAAPCTELSSRALTESWNASKVAPSDAATFW
ncbi:MAG: hypothetical protein L6R36_004602 [Xanthoria steineri]|nr:MAG: hypothetical protein L6R36_004602 [Xanthoria steineri]